MTGVIEEITLRFPRESLLQLMQLSASLTDRMHSLLERNTDGQLNETEKAELGTLVEMAHFGQILSLSLKAKVAP